MSKVLEEVLSANAEYAKNFGNKSELPMPPARQFAILTCMDARLDPAKFAGLAEGDAHVIRNAGGRANDDAINSLILSCKLLGTREWFVIQHTNCGAEMLSDGTVPELLPSSPKTGAVGEAGWDDSGDGPGSTTEDNIDLQTIKNRIASVVADVKRLRAHPLVPPEIPIYGYVYDVKTGRLIEAS